MGGQVPSPIQMGRSGQGAPHQESPALRLDQGHSFQPESRLQDTEEAHGLLF